jgi:bifunctional DNA-binding transcriptional regulator/antitoxin component of YhaV-PrlF toxin-antitoxin module
MRKQISMDRTFETTIDSQGHIDIPIDMRDRHGLTNGARVKIEERPNEVVIKTVMDENERKRIARAALDRAVGFLGTDGSILQALMDERKAERERDDRAFGSR